MPRFKTVIHWFRRDLRLSDNTGLYNAVADSENVVPVYVASNWKGEHHWTGAGRQAFLSGCLESLSKNVEHTGGRLYVQTGEPIEQLKLLINACQAEAIYLNRDPDPHGREVENKVRQLCRELGIEYCDFQDVVLHEPDEILTGAGKPYKVYTPFSNNWFDHEKPGPSAAVKRLSTPELSINTEVPTVESWGLSFEKDLWIQPGERAARERLKRAVESVISRYEEKRNLPAEDATSHLGADLRYGTLSVREVFHRSEEALQEVGSAAAKKSIRTFQRQLAWREFFMSILHHYPEVLETDFNPVWRGLDWDDPGQDDRLGRWMQGKTGFPIVDAGMRQLQEIGYMHNRVRMITAMFLTKDLHVHWRHGEALFMRHLLDGEIANNNGGWQWSSGTGADAAPYFRIQNPWTQSARWDPEGLYIKRWLPELASVDPKALSKPPDSGRPLSPDYVAPIVDHGKEREATLERFKRHREAG